jgi:hypothetical protein
MDNIDCSHNSRARMATQVLGAPNVGLNLKKEKKNRQREIEPTIIYYAKVAFLKMTLSIKVVKIN